MPQPCVVAPSRPRFRRQGLCTAQRSPADSCGRRPNVCSSSTFRHFLTRSRAAELHKNKLRLLLGLFYCFLYVIDHPSRGAWAVIVVSARAATPLGDDAGPRLSLSNVSGPAAVVPADVANTATDLNHSAVAQRPVLGALSDYCEGSLGRYSRRTLYRTCALRLPKMTC